MAPRRGCHFCSLKANRWAHSWMLESPAGCPQGPRQEANHAPAPIWGPVGKGRDWDLTRPAGCSVAESGIRESEQQTTVARPLG